MSFRLLLALFLLAQGSLAAFACNLKFSNENDVTLTVDTDHRLVQANQVDGRAILRVALQAPEIVRVGPRTPVNLVVVLDRSGSMEGAKLHRAREAAVQALRQLGPNDIFSLVTYESEIQTVIPATKVRNLKDAESRIYAITSAGSTALYGGVAQGASELRKHLTGEYFHRVVLLSDGRANVGPQSPSELGRLGVALSKENISVSTVGLGDDYNEDLMTQLSSKSDGNTYYVQESAELPELFAKELGDVLNIAARNLAIRIHCQPGVRPVSIIGSEGQIDGQFVTLDFNQLYSGQKRYALVEVALDPGEPETQRMIAETTLRYSKDNTKRLFVQTAFASVGFSSDKVKIAASAVPEVIVDYNLNRDALAQEKAILLADRGDLKGALDALKVSNTLLEEMAETYDSDELRLKYQTNSMIIQDIEDKGVDKRNRKVLRTESYQTQKQQKVRPKDDKSQN